MAAKAAFVTVKMLYLFLFPEPLLLRLVVSWQHTVTYGNVPSDSSYTYWRQLKWMKSMTLLCGLVPWKFWQNNSLHQFLELLCICVLNLLLYCIVSWQCGCPMVPNAVIHHHREEGHNYTYNQTKIGYFTLTMHWVDCCSLFHFFLTVLINKIDMVLFVN